MKIPTVLNFAGRNAFSSKSVFQVSGIVNTYNFRILGIENPRAVQKDEIHGENINVWCATHSECVLDPHYFNN